LRDVRSTPYWLDSAQAPQPCDPLTQDTVTDLAVVGGGYTGLWAALLAKERDPSRDVVLLESHQVGWAASGRNGGFCSSSLTHGLRNGLDRFADEMPLLERLGREAGAAEPVDGRRFRMLFEIDGFGPHEEDEWIGGRLEIGEAVLALTGDVGRCVVTKTNPDTAEIDLDTLGTLAAYRPEGRTERLPFGVHGAVVQPGRVRIGDSVRPVVRDRVAT
jgi:glycine/D-amino acid oxidase-like deaminating enzyme